MGEGDGRRCWELQDLPITGKYLMGTFYFSSNNVCWDSGLLKGPVLHVAEEEQLTIEAKVDCDSAPWRRNPKRIEF